MKSIDLTQVSDKYKGLWVALTESYKVITADKNARKAHAAAVNKGYKEPILFKVPKRDIAHIG
jgi:hypothetical protein